MDMLTLATLAVTLLVLAIAYGRHIFGASDLPPGPYGLPLIGYSPFLGKAPQRTLKNLRRKYGGVICVRLGTEPVIFLNDWPTVHEALGKQGDVFAGRPRTLINKIISHDYTDVIFTDGPIWREQKRFSMQILRDLGFGRSALESVIMTEVDQLTEYLDSRDGMQVDVSTLFYVPVVNVILGIAGGKRFNMTDETIGSFKDLILNVNVPKYTIINFLPFLRFLLPRRLGYVGLQTAIAKIRAFLSDTIDDHELNFDENHPRDFIDHYLAEIRRRKRNAEDRAPFTKKNLEGIVFDLFFAGSDTADTTLSWAILYMTIHPEIQKRVQAELDEVVSRDSSLPTNLTTLTPYTRATQHEINRHASIVPFGAPRRTVAETVLMGHRLPKGITVFLNMFAINHDETYWNDPEVFRPERFLDEHGRVLKHDRYIPFSAGPRVCLGESLAKMELFLFFTSLLRKFSFHPIPGEPLPSMEPHRLSTTVLKPKPFSVIVKRRM